MASRRRWENDSPLTRWHMKTELRGCRAPLVEGSRYEYLLCPWSSARKCDVTDVMSTGPLMRNAHIEFGVSDGFHCFFLE